MATVTKRTCTHSECMLPKNNHRYIWQFIYILVGLIVLLLNEEAFTFFQIFLFIAPCFLDIAYNDLGSKILNLVRIVFGAINVFLLVFCFLGMAGIIRDTGSIYTADIGVIDLHVEFPQKALAFAMGPNLIVPVVYYGTAPSQRLSLAIQLMRFFQKFKRKAE